MLLTRGSIITKRGRQLENTSPSIYMVSYDPETGVGTFSFTPDIPVEYINVSFTVET